jgi:glycosyltransferase involved in cell wall biosynthesis
MTDSPISAKDRGPAISIVMAVHNQASELRENLPQLLALDYEPGYEVIVVDESSTDDTDDVLTQFRVEHSHLYTTYIPESSHYLSRRKLALTIGVKAAHNDWVILTEPDCRPEDERWLSAMAEGMTDEADVVCAYTGYEPGTKGSYVYQRVLTWCRQKHLRPYRYDGANLAIRKNAFMERNGFLKNLKYLRGEFDFLVNETDSDRIVMLSSPESRLRQVEPTPKMWTNAQLYYMDTRPHLKHAMMSRLFFAFNQACIHLSYLLGIAALVLSIVLRNHIYIAVSSAFLLLLILLRLSLCYRRCKACGEQIAAWKLPILDLGVAWHYIRYWLRYKLSDKTNFIRK